MTTTTFSPELLGIVGRNRDTWMNTFLYASWHVATAVADGRITDADLDAFVSYDDASALAIAHKAGLLVENVDPDDGKVRESSYGGRLTHVDTEDVSISVDAIKALRNQSFLDDGASWQFYTERDDRGEWLEGFDMTLTEAEELRALAVKSYADAGRLMVEGDAWLSANRD